MNVEVALLVHRSVVHEKKFFLPRWFMAISFVSLYRAGISVCMKKFREGRAYLLFKCSRSCLKPGFSTVYTGT